MEMLLKCLALASTTGIIVSIIWVMIMEWIKS